MRTLAIIFLLGHLDFPRPGIVAGILVLFALEGLCRSSVFRDALLALGGWWCHGVCFCKMAVLVLWIEGKAGQQSQMKIKIKKEARLYEEQW